MNNRGKTKTENQAASRRANKTHKISRKPETVGRRIELFKLEYIKNGGNGVEAAIAAGYSPNRAGVTACELLKRPEIAEAIAVKAKEIEDKVGLSVERTLREVARLAYSDPRKFYKRDGTLIPIPELGDDAAACIAQVDVDEIRVDGKVIGNTVKLKQWDKNAALEKAMKYHGLYEADNKQQPKLPPIEIRFVG